MDKGREIGEGSLRGFLEALEGEFYIIKTLVYVFEILK